MIDRKKYWNEDYLKYWEMVTSDANDRSSDRTKIKKMTEGDYKTIGTDVSFCLFDELVLNPSDKLLDYGCGFGRFFEYFNEKTDYYGIDISEAMIEECKNRYPLYQNKFMVCEGESIPVQSETYDKIICYGVFDACYQEQALKEMIRVLKEGGVLLITGKNNFYYSDDEQAVIAEEAARKKGHPNYFTNVKKMLMETAQYFDIISEKYFEYRGDLGKLAFKKSMPERFYSYELILRKKSNCIDDIPTFSYEYSKTWDELKSI